MFPISKAILFVPMYVWLFLVEDGLIEVLSDLLPNIKLIKSMGKKYILCVKLNKIILFYLFHKLLKIEVSSIDFSPIATFLVIDSFDLLTIFQDI